MAMSSGSTRLSRGRGAQEAAGQGGVELSRTSYTTVLGIWDHLWAEVDDSPAV